MKTRIAIIDKNGFEVDGDTGNLPTTWTASCNECETPMTVQIDHIGKYDVDFPCGHESLKMIVTKEE